MVLPVPFVTAPHTLGTIEINQDETFELNLTLLQVNDDNSRSPYDLSHGGVVTAPWIEFIIRPHFDHTALLKKLTSPAGGIGGVIIDDAVQGRIGLVIDQATVAAELPITTPETSYPHWDYFLSEVIGAHVTELMRGPFVVFPGRRA